MKNSTKIILALGLLIGGLPACKKDKMGSASDVKSTLTACSILVPMAQAVDQFAIILGNDVIARMGVKVAGIITTNLLNESAMCGGGGEKGVQMSAASLRDIANIVGQELDATFAERDRSDLSALINQMIDYRSPPQGSGLPDEYTVMLTPAYSLESHFRNPAAPLAYVKDYTFASLLKLQLLNERLHNSIGAARQATQEGKDNAALIQFVKENAGVMHNAAVDTLAYETDLRTNVVPATVRKWFADKPEGGIIQFVTGIGFGTTVREFVSFCYKTVPNLTKGDLAAMDDLKREGKAIPAVMQMRRDLTDKPVCVRSDYCRTDCKAELAEYSDKLEKAFADKLNEMNGEVDKIFKDPEMEAAAISLRHVRDVTDLIAKLPANKFFSAESVADDGSTLATLASSIVPNGPAATAAGSTPATSGALPASGSTTPGATSNSK